MAEERILFTRYPYITANEPMNGTKFWRFIDVTGNDCFYKCLLHYLTQYGYTKINHKISPTQTRRHSLTFDHYWWTKLRRKQV